MQRDIVKPYLDSVYTASAILAGDKNAGDIQLGERKISKVVAFTQTWGSTALGFGGLGGAAMTTALTVVVSRHSRHFVFFDGRLAYTAISPNRTFFEDVKDQKMASVAEAENRYKAK